MKLVEIPFSLEMKQAIMLGWKCSTARPEEKGEIGDVFLVTDRFYRIIHIQEVILEVIKRNYYLTEGCSSPDHFDRVWRSIHRGHFSGEKKYFLHYFAYAGPNDSECTTCPFAEWDSWKTEFSCIHPDYPGIVAEDDLICPLWED